MALAPPKRCLPQGDAENDGETGREGDGAKSQISQAMASEAIATGGSLLSSVARDKTSIDSPRRRVAASPLLPVAPSPRRPIWLFSARTDLSVFLGSAVV